MTTFRRVLKYAKEYRRHFWAACICSVFMAGLALVTPLAVRELLGAVAYNANYGYDQTSTIWLIAIILLMIYAARIGLQYIIGYQSHKYAFYTAVKIRKDLYSNLQVLSPKFYQDKQIGKIVYRLMDEIMKMDNLLAHVVFDMIVGVLTFTGTAIVLFVLNPLLALLVIAPIPVLLTVGIVQRKMRFHYKEGKKQIGELYGLFTDNLQGMKEIQVFGKQEFEVGRTMEVNKRINKHILAGIHWSSLLKPIMEFLSGVGTVLVILVGGMFAMQGRIEVADVVATMLFVAILYTPIAKIPAMVEDGMDSLTSIARAFEYIDETSDVEEKEDAIAVAQLKGDIEFKDVKFSYREEQVILDDISFRIKPGTMTALVGHTGAGKTTIASLLARFFDIQSGVITIDGIDIRDMTLQSLRNNLSIVLQDIFLFNGTIGENIVYGRRDVPTHEELVDCAKQAQIHDFVSSLPAGYDTLIGERGVRLSGGQKQRLAIARALLRNSPILILDEATSSIDNTTERRIQQAIENLSNDKTKTIIVIAHRLSTIEKADQVLYIEDGKVLESGSHDELIKKKGPYASLHASK